MSPRAALGAVLGSAILLLATLPAVIGAEPSPSAAGGDVRTDPAAPGLVGDPLFAVAGVLLIGLAAVALTLLATRLGDRGHR